MRNARVIMVGLSVVLLAALPAAAQQPPAAAPPQADVGPQGHGRRDRQGLDRQGRCRQQAGPDGQGLEARRRGQGLAPRHRPGRSLLEPGQCRQGRLHGERHLQRSRTDLQPSAPVRRVHRRLRSRDRAQRHVLRRLSQRQLHHPHVQRRQARRRRRSSAGPRGREEGRDAQVARGPGSGAGRSRATRSRASSTARPSGPAPRPMSPAPASSPPPTASSASA